MKISDLNKISIDDLKNIDYNKFLADFKKKPETVISISVIMLTLFLSWNVYGNRQKEFKRLKSQIATLEAKQKSIDQLIAAKEETKKFWDSVPKPLGEEELLNMITDIAAHRKILIESLVPSRRESAAFYNASVVNLIVAAKNYQDIWLFAYDLENSNYGIRIDNWNMRLANSQEQQRSRPNQLPSSEGNISIQLSLTVINFKPDAGDNNETKKN